MSEYRKYGYIDFSKLWSLLQKKKLNKQYLINNGIHRNTIYKLVNNENVTAEVICKLCYILDTQPKNILEYRKPEPDPLQIDQEPEEPEQIDTLPEDPWRFLYM